MKERATPEECTTCHGEGCDISYCMDCGVEYHDPCQRHREAGHVPSSDPYGDDTDCATCCPTCHGASCTPQEADRG